MKRIFILTAFILSVLNASAQGTWVQKTNFAGTCRKFAAGFSINAKGYVVTGEQSGGTDINGPLWEYDQPTDTWSSLNSFVGTGRAWSFGVSAGNQTGYIIAGANIGQSYTDNEEFDPIGNAWSSLPAFGGTARYASAGFVIGSKIYFGTGDDQTGSRNDFWVYNIGTGAWTQLVNFGGTPRRAAIGFAIGSTGYMGTGMDGSLKNDIWAYDPTANSWAPKNNFGGSARQYAVGFSMNGKGYIGTGNDGLFTNDFWEYDPTLDSWIQVASLPANARWGAVAIVINSKAYVGTGGTNSAYFCDWWEYTPNPTGVVATALENSISIYPNPTNGKFAIKSKFTDGEISVYNIVGKIVYQSSLSQNEIDLSNQEKGIYFVRINSIIGSVTKKIIVE